MNSTDGNVAIGGCEMIKRAKPITVGEHLDTRIARIRQELECTCILKAKAEAAQMLDKPMDFMSQLVGYPY